MSKECEKISKFSGKISKPAQKLCFEIDESYFKAKHKSDLDSSTKYLDYSKAYDGLVDYANLAHCRVKYLKNKF